MYRQKSQVDILLRHPWLRTLLDGRGEMDVIGKTKNTLGVRDARLVGAWFDSAIGDPSKALPSVHLAFTSHVLSGIQTKPV